MNQVTENLGLEIGGITDEPSLIPNMVTNLIKLDQAIGQGSADQVARAAAAAAQADATQALSDAGTAEALAQQALESGMKLKQLSETEMKSICAFPESATGTPGIDSIVSNNNQHFVRGYVINITPRLKLVYICTNLVTTDMSSYTNSQVYVRNQYAQPRMKAVIPIFVTNDSTMGTNTLALQYNETINAFGITITPSSTLSTGQINFGYNFLAMIEYNTDTDLGTDIE